MAKNVPVINFEKIFSTSCELPYCKINREEFLTKELKKMVSPEQLANALKNGTVGAGIPITVLDTIAKGSIKLETLKVTALSTAAGIPGGFVMIGTIPADLAQFYAHVFRIVQKLAYTYGAKELDLSDGTQNALMIYLGAMFGVSAAGAALAKFAAENATKIGARVAAKPLTKYAIYNISKKVLVWIGVKLTKVTVGKGVSKAVPIVGGVISGGLSFTIYRHMANKLRKELAKYAAMTPEDLAKASEVADVILADIIDISEEPLLEENDN